MYGVRRIEHKAQLVSDPNIQGVLRARFFAPVLDGRQGYVAAVDVRAIDSIADLVPAGATVLALESERQRIQLIETKSWSMLLSRSGGGWTSLMVRSSCESEARAVLDTFKQRVPKEEIDTTQVAVDFWQKSDSMYTTTRRVASPGWAEIRGNYPPPVSGDLDSLMDNPLDAPVGRIVLWHGPPGTGKTTAIRALAGAWRDKARFQIVLDPEMVFASATPLMEVVLGENDTSDDGQEPMWRVLVVEDADNLVGVGGSDSRVLSRLLNVGDGIVGQGLRILLLLTTNQAPDALHPALSRPGRCLAHTDFRRFTRAEAVAQFGSEVPDMSDVSLAEILNGTNETKEPVRIGQYL